MSSNVTELDHGRTCVGCEFMTRRREVIFGYVVVPICERCASVSGRYEVAILAKLTEAFRAE